MPFLSQAYVQLQAAMLDWTVQDLMEHPPGGGDFR
jgi:hypothetical protein